MCRREVTENGRPAERTTNLIAEELEDTDVSAGRNRLESHTCVDERSKILIPAEQIHE